MLGFAQRRDTMIGETSGTAPHHDVTAFKIQTAHLVGTPVAAPKECVRHAKRDGNNRSPCIVFVAVLMKTEFASRNLAIDKASVRIIRN